MAKKIATENEAYAVAGKQMATAENKMCTRERAIEIGCDVNALYANNQLVAYEDLSKAQQLVITPQTVTLIAFGLNTIVDFKVSCPSNFLWQTDLLVNASHFKKMIYDALSPKSGIGPGTITLSSIYPGVISGEVITFNNGDAAITFISE